MIPKLRVPALIAILAASSCWQAAVAQLPTEPVQGYVYVEAFELRKEFAFQLSAVSAWKDAANREDIITPEVQDQLLREFQALLDPACPISADGEPLKMELDRILFVKIIPELGVLPDDRERIPAAEALIAAVYSTSMEDFPKTIELTWDFFPGASTKIPVTFVSPNSRASLDFTKETTTQSWTVPNTEVAPGLLKSGISARSARLQIPIISSVLLGIALLAGIAARFAKDPKKIALCGIVAILGLLGSFTLWRVAVVGVRDPTVRMEIPTEDEAGEIVTTLLRNVYHAFDYRDEGRIYDTLAYTIEGDQLEQLYLDIRRGLELEDQGGPRVKIQSIDLRECYPEALGQRSGFRVDADWVAVGAVTHWGHTHQRINKYHAWLTVEPIQGRWKLTMIDVVEEGRL